MTDALRGGPVAGREPHKLEVECSIPSPATTPVLSAEERAVLTEVQRHRGRPHAVGLDLVACVTGLAERQVQYIIVRLIERHGVPIGSAVTKPMGYFLIETEDELAESLSQLVHRITALAKRIAAMKRSTVPIVLNQMAIDMDPPKEAA